MENDVKSSWEECLQIIRHNVDDKQYHIWAEHSSYHAVNELAVVLRQELIEVLAGQAEGQYVLLEGDDLNRFEPDMVLFVVYVVADDLKTLLP